MSADAIYTKPSRKIEPADVADLVLYLRRRATTRDAVLEHLEPEIQDWLTRTGRGKPVKPTIRERLRAWWRVR